MRKILSILYFSCIGLIINSTYADTFMDTRSDGGNVSVFYTLSVRNDPYYTQIYDASIQNWNNISPNVTLSRTYSSENVGTFLFVDESHRNPELLWYIVPYTKNSLWQIVPNTYWINETWYRTDVRIIKENMNNSNMSWSQQVSNATHELGHTLKLAHPWQGTDREVKLSWWQKSVMNQWIQDIWPQWYDKDDIRYKWWAN